MDGSGGTKVRWVLPPLIALLMFISAALVVTGSQDKTILVHSLEEGDEGQWLGDAHSSCGSLIC